MGNAVFYVKVKEKSIYMKTARRRPASSGETASDDGGCDTVVFFIEFAKRANQGWKSSEAV